MIPAVGTPRRTASGTTERMRTFVTNDDDLAELVSRAMRGELQRAWKRLAGTLAAASVLAWAYPLAAALFLGMCVAWSYSVWERMRSLRRWYRSRHGRAAGPVTVEFRPEGIYTAMPTGKATVGWSALTIKEYVRCIAVELDGSEVLILPKRQLTAGELDALRHKRAAPLSYGATVH
jgi:hypothetical protein